MLIAGIVLVSVVAVAVMGAKVSDQFGVMAAVMPGAHAPDNMPVSGGIIIPFGPDKNGRLVLDSANLVSTDGTLDRMGGIIGTGGGELLIIDN